VLHDSQWERLGSFAPDDVCRRADVEYDAEAGCYLVPLLNRRVRVNPAARSVEWGDGAAEGERPPGYNATLASVVYLLEAQEMYPAGEWVTGESLPAGAFFFRGAHAMPTAEMARRFGKDPAALLATGARLGGKPGDMGDACVELEALPRVAMRVVLWVGDDEFPSRAMMLFDRLVDAHLPLDALYCLVQHVASALVAEGAEGALM